MNGKLIKVARWSFSSASFDNHGSLKDKRLGESIDVECPIQWSRRHSLPLSRNSRNVFLLNSKAIWRIFSIIIFILNSAVWIRSFYHTPSKCDFAGCPVKNCLLLLLPVLLLFVWHNVYTRALLNSIE